MNGDLQTVLTPQERHNQGVGVAFVRTVLAYAWEHGVGAVTVAANGRAL